MPKTIEELARRYAHQLGHDAYPATDFAPTAARKISALYTAYWNGWDAAGAEYWLERRCADRRLDNRTTLAT